MSKWQNLDAAGFDCYGKYGFPLVFPVRPEELPRVDKFITFDFVSLLRPDEHDRSKVVPHFFIDDFKFERCWTSPDRYGETLKDFGYVIGPDFSVYADWPLAVRIYNHYRNCWLTRYWQEMGITVVPTVMWEYEDSWEWCFDSLPKNSVVAVSNVGCTARKDQKEYFMNGYLEMLRRLEPAKVLFFSRNCPEVPGNVTYIHWEIHKGDQLNGKQ